MCHKTFYYRLPTFESSVKHVFGRSYTSDIIILLFQRPADIGMLFQDVLMGHMRD